MSELFSPSADLATVIEISEGAGEILLGYRGSEELDVSFKRDEFDPVSKADQEADAYIRSGLGREFPDDEILSEENGDVPASYDGRVWMVDPLDGTKDYLHGRDSFSTLIGLLVNGKLTLGVVHAAARGITYCAEVGRGAWKRENGLWTRMHVSDVADMNEARLVTRFVTPGDVRPIEARLAALNPRERIPEGSVGIKAALVADGQADIFVHTNTGASKWDTLAPAVIVSEAGGVMSDIDGNPLDHRRKRLDWDRYIVVANGPILQDVVVQMLDGFEA